MLSPMPPQSTSHPLDPLSATELEAASGLIKFHVEKDTKLWFKYITLLEPPKKELVPFLLAERTSSPISAPDRIAAALVALKTSSNTSFVEFKVSLSSSSVLSTRTLDEGEHAGIDGEEMLASEEALLKNPEFLTAIDGLQLPAGSTVVADPWIYGCDTTDKMGRLIPFMLYYRASDHADENHYTRPIPLIPVLRADDFSLYALQYTPIFSGTSTETILDLQARGEQFPWDKFEDREYDLEAARGSLVERDTLKPLEVVQREGAGFKVEGRKVSWEKWEMRVGFNYREGLTVHDVKYDGRDIFHRLSVSDMTVPYGDPRAPLHRKQAFDLGDVGAGLCANSLDLGCDCLGLIQYLDADLIKSDGTAQKMKNVICLHEQDEGIGFKHTNFRTNRPSVTRNRVLVIQQIITVANYGPYVFAFKFDQSANFHLETRATGILSTCTILPGETSPYGTIVAPGVLATNHQHLFSVRIDPAIGKLGEGNTVVQEDSVPMAFDPDSPPEDNLYGVGYTVEKSPIATSGWADAAPEKNRVFKIINSSHINPVSGRPIGYKLVPTPSQLLLAHPKSIAYARAEFAGHHVWVTQHRDEELFSAGQYTNQSCGKANGIRTWVARDDVVEDADLVLWHTFGLTHNPRVEDFPVMPCETHSLKISPVDFFEINPGMDVPRSTQAVNGSVLNGSVPPSHGVQGSAELEEKAATSGGCCK